MRSGRERIKVDLTGMFLVAKTFLTLLKKGLEPSVVNITNLAGQIAGVVGIAYHTTKAGIIGLTRKLALELASIDQGKRHSSKLH